MKIIRLSFAIVFVISFGLTNISAEKKKYDFIEAMKFNVIKKSILSADGNWVAYTAQPERGDPTGYIRSVVTDSLYTVNCGINPDITKNSRWAGFIVKPKAIEAENAEKKKPKNGLSLVNLTNGKSSKFENVKSFEFSLDSRWAAITLSADDSKKDPDSKVKSSDVILRDLDSETQLIINNISSFAFDSLSNFFAYITESVEGKDNGVYVINLKGSFTLPKKIESREKGSYSTLNWSNRSGILAYVSCNKSKAKLDSNSLRIWNSSKDELLTAASPDNIANGWFIPHGNKLDWTDDDNRLFFGVKPFTDSIPASEKLTYNDTNYFDIKTILKKINLSLWHWNDPRIKTNEHKWWDDNKNRTFTSVYDLNSKSAVQLADLSCPDVTPVDNPSYAIGYDETPYLKSSTWEGSFFDIYKVSISTGEKKLVATKVNEQGSISPNGNFLVFFKDLNWHMYNTNTDSVANLTYNVGQPFYDEDNDVPAAPNSYGVAGWIENDFAVLLYDKYDVWTFYTSGNGYISQTALEGRDNNLQLRLLKLDKRQKFFKRNESIWTSGFNTKSKETGVFKIDFNTIGPELIQFEKRKYSLLAQSDNAKTILFTKQSFDEVPDLWIGDSALKVNKKVTDYGKQLESYNWGKAELVSWVNFDGDTLDGIIYKPANYNPKKRYPVMVYYYERFSDGLYNFNSPYIGHRPAFQIYNDEGYVFFLPDIKFKTAYPGYSAVSCIVSGIRHLANLGIADTNALGITGHSWSGYQTAFMVTQTNMFAAAVAGAPVGNMTSAYSGIRNGTGLARQFQYEMGQSRIGGDLWDSLDAYIRNSPVFHVKNTSTPLMIMFGDDDWAVPWQQGQEIYLAWRRLNKNCIFLQYFDEPHWPEKFHNRLDYALRMKEFFDTYVLKKTAPDWITNGIKYKGKED
jgi:dipeptidyl aminopeptidase/acylaminoacyl peptidase